MFSNINGGNPWQFQLQSLQQQLTQLQNQMTQPSLPQSQPMMQNMFQQPQPQLQAPAQPQIQPVNKSSVPIVHGNDGARSLASTMLPASSVVAMDADDIIFYFIATDANGVPTMEAYKGKKIEDKPVVPEEYVLKSDYDKLQNQVKDLSDAVNNINKNNTDKSQQRRDNK